MDVLTDTQKNTNLESNWYWATDILDRQEIIYVQENQEVLISGCEKPDPITAWKDFIPVVCYRDTVNINLKISELMNVLRS